MVAVDAEHLLALEIDELTAKLLSVQLNVLANALNDECPQIIWTKAQRNMVVEGVIHRLHESASRGDKDVTAIGNCLDAVCFQGCKTLFDGSTFCSHFRRCQRTVDHHLHKGLGFGFFRRRLRFGLCCQLFFQIRLRCCLGVCGRRLLLADASAEGACGRRLSWPLRKEASFGVDFGGCLRLLLARFSAGGSHVDFSAKGHARLLQLASGLT
mmetsp:Transcript_43812/g.76295  ORF Transcript_43812/g.76295 Transcript_43812/m.76295 type:complete len:212 (+) Transcript_43812:1227-1862(+)